MTTDSQDFLDYLMNSDPVAELPLATGEMADILEHQLSLSLRSEVEILSETSGLPACDVVAMLDDSGDSTFHEVLDNGTREECLSLIKEFAKYALAHDDLLPREVARVIYIWAILRGRYATSSVMTSMDDAELKNAARRCLTLAWLPDSIRASLRNLSPIQ